MDTKIKDYLGIALIIVALAFTFAAISYTLSYANSVELGAPSFSVSGEGTVTVVPDVAQFTFNILTEGGEDLSTLQSENSAAANRTIDFLKNEGVADEDIKTRGYSVQPRYQYFDCFYDAPYESGVYEIYPGEEISVGGAGITGIRTCPPSEIVGYTINQSVQVKVRNLDNAGKILAGVVDNGANSVSQLAFTVDDPIETENEARAEAIAQAKEKAEAIADAGDFRLGKLLSIDTSGFRPVPYYGIGGAESLRIDDAVPPIEPGSEEITVNVTLIYEIK